MRHRMRAWRGQRRAAWGRGACGCLPLLRRGSLRCSGDWPARRTRCAPLRALRSNMRREFDGRRALCAQASHSALLGCARARAPAPRSTPSPMQWRTAMERSTSPGRSGIQLPGAGNKRGTMAMPGRGTHFVCGVRGRTITSSMKPRNRLFVGACQGRHQGAKRSRSGAKASIRNAEGAPGRRPPCGQASGRAHACVAPLAQAASLGKGRALSRALRALRSDRAP